MMKKLSETAKNGDSVVKIVGSVLQVCAVVFVVFAVLVLILGEKMFAPGSLTLDMDFIKLYLSQDYQTVTDLMKLYTVAGLLSAAVAFGMVSWCCRLLRRILAPMIDGRPFDGAVPGALKQASWAVMIGGAMIQLLGIGERFLATKVYPMDAVFASAAIERWEFTFSVDCTFVLVFFVLQLLSYVFSYGAALQQESDETL